MYAISLSEHIAHCKEIQQEVTVGKVKNTFWCKQQITSYKGPKEHTHMHTHRRRKNHWETSQQQHTHISVHAHTHISRIEEIIKHLGVNSVERSAVLLKGDFVEMGMENEDCLCGPV